MSILKERQVDTARPAFIENSDAVDAQKELGRNIISAGIETLFLVGCGGSLAAYGPSAFTLINEVPQLAVQVMTSDEFNLRKPRSLGNKALVIVGSHTGNTPETVRAIQTARDAGAAQVVALTSNPDSPLAKNADIAFSDTPRKWAWDPKEMAMARITQGICAAVGIENPELDHALSALPTAIPTLLTELDPKLHDMAERLAAEPIIYVIGSGPMEVFAHGLAMFYLQEMLWLHAAAYNAGEFFHGPFEVATADTPYIVLCGEDETRPMTDRALSFLNTYSDKVHTLDSSDFTLTGVPQSARAEVAPIVMSAVTTRLAQHFEAVLDHDLSTRRYMFTVEY